MVKFEDLINKIEAICVVGLGYVGLPLAVLLSKKFRVIGYDKNKERIKQLISGIDVTKEVDNFLLKENKNLEFTFNDEAIKKAKFIIIAVPTPIDKLKDPDLSFLKTASQIVGRNLSKNTIVVYESTVYPGATEEICIPIIEKESNLKWKKDFYVGYSPERVNPGDKKHTLEKITKVVAGDTKETTELLAKVYGSVIKAGIYKAPSIKVAEAAKVIENVQRDINIALINELALIFHKLGLDTKEVLDVATTKWNFLKFTPGLVGGHCIGIDPYYLAYASKRAGYIPQLILAGRSINEHIPEFIAQELVKILIKNNKKVKGGKVLIMGFTFKENVPDVRNTKVYDIVKYLEQFDVNVYVYDPIANKDEVKNEYGFELIQNISNFAPYDAIIVAVKHSQFLKMKNLSLKKFKKVSTNPPILFDIKSIFDKNKVIKEGFIYWRL